VEVDSEETTEEAIEKEEEIRMEATKKVAEEDIVEEAEVSPETMKRVDVEAIVVEVVITEVVEAAIATPNTKSNVTKTLLAPSPRTSSSQPSSKKLKEETDEEVVEVTKKVVKIIILRTLDRPTRLKSSTSLLSKTATRTSLTSRSP